LAPFRKVTEIAVEHGQPWKVIRLQPAVKQLMAIGKPTATTSLRENLPYPASVQKATPIQGKTETPAEDERLTLIRCVLSPPCAKA
jgi:hypothetical protein